MSTPKKFSEAHTASSKDSPAEKPKDTSVSDKPAIPPNKALAKEMARYGITRVPVDYYHYGAFRYTSLKDALAQAKRTVQR